MQIDLSSLPPPKVVEELSFETIVAAIKADLTARLPEIAPTLEIETAVVTKLIQACAYRELLLRARINDAARSVMLAFAQGEDLDQIGGTFGVERLIVTPATPNDPVVMEDDERFRYRIQLGIIAYSVAGPIEAYIYHALTADPTISDAAVNNPFENRVDLTILSANGDGVATSEQLAAVVAALSPETARPLTDDLRVRSASIVNQTISVLIRLRRGPSPATIQAAAISAIAKHAASRRKVGRVLRIDGIIAAARSAGDVEQVIVQTPANDVDPGISGAVNVTAINVITEVLP